MWYFSWILGMGLACSFSVLNALWYEINSIHKAKDKKDNLLLNIKNKI